MSIIALGKPGICSPLLDSMTQEEKDAIAKIADAVVKATSDGRLQNSGGFNWIRSDKTADAIVPTHGNFAGPGYGAGNRVPHTVEELEAAIVATVTDPVTGVERNDYIDLIAKPHDIAYTKAEKLTGDAKREAIIAADQALINATQELLTKDGRGEITLTVGERDYGNAMLSLFKLKQGFNISKDNVMDETEYLAEIWRLVINDALSKMNRSPQYPAMPAGSYDTRRCHPPIDPTKPNSFTNSKSWRPAPSDPFILDLDGDGVETVNVTSGILFDHNADGVKTGTGWVKGDDALLVRDLNDNGTIDSGRELFGDQTLLTNGQLAANGFAALRDLDANADGMIDASDAAFDQLKVWRDLNQDGISQADELQTLAEAGIASIGLTSTPKNQWNNANTIATAGTYTRADGTTGTTGDVNLAINTAVTEFTDEIEVPETLLDLPEMSGSGQVRNLQQAAALSPALTDLIRQYAVATTRDAQLALMDQMLLAWADTSAMAKSLDERAKADYRIEYLGFGTVNRYDHLIKNTTFAPVGSAVTNSDSPFIDETYRNRKHRGQFSIIH